MYYFAMAGIVCLFLALINLLFVIQNGWFLANIIALILSVALALYNFYMAAKT